MVGEGGREWSSKEGNGGGRTGMMGEEDKGGAEGDGEEEGGRWRRNRGWRRRRGEESRWKIG